MIDVISNINLDTKRRLNTLLNEQTRRMGMLDLQFFCKNILGYSDLTTKDGFHGEFCTHLENKNRKFKLSLTPRGSLKSSIGTIGHPIQEILKDPNIRILIASEKFTISTKFLTEIKGHFEKNARFRTLYGDLVGKDKWTESEIIVNTRNKYRKEPTISCAGIDVTKVGMHYDMIKVDDPHSDQNTQSQDQIEKVIRWYRLLFSLLDPGGYLDISGTIWHYGDLYNYIINKERERKQKGYKKRFTVFKRVAFEGTQNDLLEDKVTEDKLLWPERLTAEFLKDTLIEQGPYIFSCQYLLNPVDDETAVFKRSWIKTCTREQVPKNITVYSTIDPMRDEEGKDYLAITTCGVDIDWKIYILDVRRLKADEHETVDEMYRVYQKWAPLKMGFESVAWQKTYYNYVKMLQIMKNIKMPVSELKTDTKVTKRMRIKSMVPYWKAGLFILVTNKPLDMLTGGKAALIDELTRYPKVANDDCVDALAYMNQLTKRPGVLHILRKISPNSFKGIKDRMRKPKGKLGIYNIRGGTRAH